MECLRCKVSMEKRKLTEQQEELELDQCPQCEGVWLNARTMAQLESIVEPVMWEVRQIPQDIDQLIGLYCPTCAGHPLLVKADHHRDSKVVIDYCSECQGCWLDKGELQAIQQEQFFVSVFHLLRDLHGSGNV